MECLWGKYHKVLFWFDHNIHSLSKTNPRGRLVRRSSLQDSVWSCSGVCVRALGNCGSFLAVKKHCTYRWLYSYLCIHTVAFWTTPSLENRTCFRFPGVTPSASHWWLLSPLPLSPWVPYSSLCLVKKLIFHILEWLSSMSKISLLLYASPLIFVSSDINPPLQQLNIKGLSVLLGPPSKTASTNYSCSCTAQEISGKLLLRAHSEWDCQRGMKNWGSKGDSIAWWGSLPMAMTYMNTQLCCLFLNICIYNLCRFKDTLNILLLVLPIGSGPGWSLCWASFSCSPFRTATASAVTTCTILADTSSVAAEKREDKKTKHKEKHDNEKDFSKIIKIKQSIKKWRLT